MPITRVEQLEQALAYAREVNADLQRRHEAAERSWSAQFLKLEQRIAFFESCLTADVVTQSKRAVGTIQ